MTLQMPSKRDPPAPTAVCERSRRYSRSMYLWTLSQWDENRADIERRTATAALNAIMNGQRFGTPTPPTSHKNSLCEEKPERSASSSSSI